MPKTRKLSPLKDYLPFGRPNISDEEIDSVVRVLRSGWLGMGPETIAFEKELAMAVGSPHVVTVNSCTSALFLSLLVHGVGKGDEVICPSLTWCSTANAALYLGATPVFCDVDSETLCATAETIQKVVTAKTKAVIVVHFGGLAADIAAIRAKLPKRICLIEDAAHAFGAKFDGGKPVGSSGNPTCFSFYANKNLVAAEGGAVSIFDGAMADRIRSLRQHALPLDAWKRFTHPKTVLLSNQLTELGYKMNFTDLQAAIGRGQLRRQKSFIQQRRAIAKEYSSKLAKLKIPLKLQSSILGKHHARHLFTIQLPLHEMKLSREEFILALRSRNIGATIHYAPLHTMPLYKSQRRGKSLPHTELISRSIVTLPISSSMTVAQAAQVADHVAEILA